MQDVTSQQQPGCAQGCGGCLGLIIIAAVLVLMISNCDGGSSSAPAPAPVDPDPVHTERQGPSLCEGMDYVNYDDCKDFEDIPGPR